MTTMPVATKQARIAFVTNDPYRFETLESMASESGWELFITDGPADQWLVEEEPSLVIVDLDVPQAVAQLTELSISAPSMPLLALSTPEHLADLQDALMAGAKTFIPFPVTNPQFVAAVARLLYETQLPPATPAPAPTPVPEYLQAQPAADPAVEPQQMAAPATPQQPRIIAVAGLKGGIGRSVVSANLGAALQMQGHDVILVESHMGLSDLSLMLSLHPTRTISDLYEEPEFDLDIVKGTLTQHESGLRLLSASTRLEDMVELPSENWPHLLSMLTEIAPTVIVDTGSMADAVLSEILTAADDIIVVTKAHTVGLNATWPLLETLRNGVDVHGRIHLVLNRADVQGAASRSTVSKHLQQNIDIELLDDVPLVVYSINRGVPFVFDKPRAMLSRRFFDLADKLNGIHTHEHGASTGSGSSDGLFSALRVKAAAIASFF